MHADGDAKMLARCASCCLSWMCGVVRGERMDDRSMAVRWWVCRAACGPVVLVGAAGVLCVSRLVLVSLHATAVLIYI